MARFLTPGCTRAVRAAGSMSRMRMNFASDSTTPCLTGVAPPDSPVPAPRATTGTRSSWHSFSTATTCSSRVGSATSSGSWR
jgi:hypothetical protein